MSTLRNTILGTTVLLAGTILAGCNGGTIVQRMDRDMSRQSEAYQAWWQQEVVYHRNANVYYSPKLETYWWFENEAWQESSTPPAHLSVNQGAGVQVVKLSRLLKSSLNSPNVMAFNPYYQPGQEGTPMNEFAPTRDQMAPLMAEAETESASDQEPTTESQAQAESGFLELKAQPETPIENRVKSRHAAFPETESETETETRTETGATTLVDDEDR